MTTTRHRTIAATATAAALCATLLTGCDGTAGASTAPATTPTAPSPSTTPTSATPNPTPSVDPLVTQAEAVYRKQFDVIRQIYLLGGLPMGAKPPATLTQYVTGQALADRVSELNQVNELGLKHVSGSSTISVVRVSAQEMAGAVVALESCEDGRRLVSKGKNGKSSTGDLVHVISYYARSGTGLKMMYFLNHRVASCPVQ